jgi:hypothetical protein
MLLHILIVAAFGGLLYFLVNRAPVIAPTVRAILKWVIMAVTCLIILGILTGHNVLPGL